MKDLETSHTSKAGKSPFLNHPSWVESLVLSSWKPGHQTTEPAHWGLAKGGSMTQEWWWPFAAPPFEGRFVSCFRVRGGELEPQMHAGRVAASDCITRDGSLSLGTLG